MKLSSEMLQNLSYFWNKNYPQCFFSSFQATLDFWFWQYLQKYGKFWSISLDNFIKHKLLFSEEWMNVKAYIIVKFYTYINWISYETHDLIYKKNQRRARPGRALRWFCSVTRCGDLSPPWWFLGSSGDHFFSSGDFF